MNTAMRVNEGQYDSVYPVLPYSLWKGNDMI